MEAIKEYAKKKLNDIDHLRKGLGVLPLNDYDRMTYILNGAEDAYRRIIREVEDQESMERKEKGK